MSGRYEKEIQIDSVVKCKLSGLPAIVTDYYYSLLSEGKSYRTAQTYIDRLARFIQYTFNTSCPDDFYLNVRSTHINRYISSLRTNTSGGKTKKMSDSYKTVSWSALNSFFQFLVPEYIVANPVANTNRPKMKDNPEVTYLNESEVAKVLENVTKKANKRMVN